jgi:hypothetical protein
MNISDLLIAGGGGHSKTLKINGPSRILQIKNVASFELTNKFEKCREVYSDVWYMCEQFGVVVSIKIPRPIWVPGREREI